MAQDTYRSELFAANTYLEQYGEEMEQSLANQIAALYAQATEMDSDKVDIAGNLDWGIERSNYTQDGFAARDIMLSVIDAMEQATADNAAQDARQQSGEIVEQMQDEHDRTTHVRINSAALWKPVWHLLQNLKNEKFNPKRSPCMPRDAA